MSDSKTVSDLRELKSITTEIKRLNAEMKLLRLKKKEKEEGIAEYLREKNQPGVKYGDLVVLSKESIRRKRLKKKEKEEKAIAVLEDMGVADAKTALTNILDSMKGEQYTTETIQIKETKS
jgi:hypothetical protein